MDPFSRVVARLKNFAAMFKIPEDAKVFSYRLINISGKVPENPVRWKLTYMDQYGRGGSLDIVTQFE